MVLNPISHTLLFIVQLAYYLLFGWVIMSVLINFGILNRYQPVVYRIFEFLERLVEPPLRKVRRYVPLVAGFDLSPLVLFVGLEFLRQTILYLSF
jgi:YggT family protein